MHVVHRTATATLFPNKRIRGRGVSLLVVSLEEDAYQDN